MIKKINTSIFFLSYFVLSVAGQSSHSFTLDIKTGILHGASYELVYSDSSSSNYASELTWDIKPLAFIGLLAEYAPKDLSSNSGFYGSIGLKIGVPMITGVMENKDWLTPTTNPGSLSLFSSHDNNTKTAILADFEIGLSIPVVARLSMKFYLGISYMYFKYEAWNGYTQYGSNDRIATQDNPYVTWDSSWPKEYINGMGIDYTQQWFIVRPGLRFAWSVKHFMLNMGVSVSPVVFCSAKDNHYWRYPPFLAISNISGGI